MRILLSQIDRPRLLPVMIVRARKVVSRWLSARHHRVVQAELAVHHVLAGFTLIVRRMEEPFKLVVGFVCIISKWRMAITDVTVE
jgi:hypothetical protein